MLDKVRLRPVADEHAGELRRIIAERRITTVFQPIRSLADGNLLGYEALSRGPEDGPLTMPDQLFGVAERSGQLLALERACREAALRNAVVFAASLGEPGSQPVQDGFAWPLWEVNRYRH